MSGKKKDAPVPPGQSPEPELPPAETKAEASATEAPATAQEQHQDEPAKTGAIATDQPAATPAQAEPRYRVWPHGNLQADGQLFKAGEDVPYGLRNEPCVEAY